jgi:cysteinyl-tRNA synthetase
MSVKIYNTLTRKKEVFEPIKKGHVGIYSCGPTVYWYQHIGNMRTYVSNDIIKRVFLYNGYKVKHVINVTDVGHLTSDADTGEDKMEKAAKKEGKKASEIAQYYFDIFREDLRKLNILEPSVWPKASEHIKEQIDLIKTLEKKGYTYNTNDGVYFDTSRLEDYGKLARLNAEELRAGKRIEVGEKKNKTDFALWKFSTEPGVRQQEWKSPWGLGFPGWHVECSAMSSKYLGKQFDVHTGGQEHIAVHHTNEIAQSESAFGKKPWVKYWIHFAWLLFKGKKVSKSEGGLYTLSQLEEKNYDALAFRYLCLTTHYGKPLNFSVEILNSAMRSYLRLKNIVSQIKNSKDKKNKKNIETVKKQFLEIVDDDFNTSKGLAFLWEILRDDRLNDSEKYELALDFDKIFGLELEKEEVKKGVTKKDRELVQKRFKAKKEKDFKTADKIREDLIKKGHTVADNSQGVSVSGALIQDPYKN